MFPTYCLLHETTEEYKEGKRKRGLCVTYRCQRKTTLAARSQRQQRCNTCKSRLFRLRNPDQYAYFNLKASAAKRGIGFNWAFEDFLEFCAITDYVELRGKDPHSLSIDRIDNSKPYQLGNVRIMTYADNVSHRYEGPHHRSP